MRVLDNFNCYNKYCSNMFITRQFTVEADMMIEQHVKGNFADAIDALASGRIVLLHDSSSRENEIDMIAASQFCTPDMIALMREKAGGLICSAIGNDVASVLQLPFMHDIIDFAKTRYPRFSSIIDREMPYGGKPAFSLSLNHRSVFTGVTDKDRSLTVSTLGSIAMMVKNGEQVAADAFYSEFKTPGHVPLLIEAEESLTQRRGHTELSIHLARLAGLAPATVVCEMQDSNTHGALSVGDAVKFADRFGVPFVDGDSIH